MPIVRNFNDSDLPALLDFVVPPQQGVVHADAEVHRSVFTDIMQLPGRDRCRDCILLYDDASDGPPALQGFCLVFPEPLGGRCVLNVHVAPGIKGREHGIALIRAGLRRSRQIGEQLVHIGRWAPYEDASDLTSQGFRMERVFWNMAWQKQPLPDPKSRDGLVIRSFRESDVALLTEGHNSAFAGSWGYSPMNETQTAYRAGMANTSFDGIKLLLSDHRLAGYCWTLLMSDGQRMQGVIGSIGLTPDFRGQGLSKVILTAGLEYLVSAGADYVRLEVDGANAPAIALYRSLGFEKIGELHWYERPL